MKSLIKLSYKIGTQKELRVLLMYTVKFGRTLVMSTNIPTPAAQKHSNKWGVSRIHLLLEVEFRWLLQHATLPICQSLKRDVTTVFRQCYCGDMQETTKHTL